MVMFPPNPVMFPPGLAKFEMIPKSMRVPGRHEYDGNPCGGLLGRQRRRRPVGRHDHGDGETNELGGQRLHPLVPSLGGASLDADRPSLDPAEIGEPTGTRVAIAPALRWPGSR
jgi:hypothetical protein